jgi:hypothetical protein
VTTPVDDTPLVTLADIQAAAERHRAVNPLPSASTAGTKE